MNQFIHVTQGLIVNHVTVVTQYKYVNPNIYDNQKHFVNQVTIAIQANM